MRRTLAVVLSAAALSFGGVGVADATVNPPTATTSVVAQGQTAQDDNGSDSDNTGLWGLAGLLGLLGLAGLKPRRNQTPDARGYVAPPAGGRT